MILIVTALKAETTALIENLKLKYIKETYPVYASDRFTLVISGVGMFNACAATSWAFAKFNNIKGVLNYGSAGAPSNINTGEVFLCNKISTQNENDIITDTFFEHSLKGASVSSFSAPVKNNAHLRDLCDMEAYGFAAAACKYISPDKIVVIKLTSDSISAQSIPTKDDIVHLFDNSYNEFSKALFSFEQYCTAHSYVNPESIFNEVHKFITAKYKLTISQQHILKSALHNSVVYYSSLPDISALPEADSVTKKSLNNAFLSLLNNINSNINSTPCQFSHEKDIPIHHFQKIYYEHSLENSIYLNKVFSKFPHSEYISVKHYKNVFNRHKQNIQMQSANKNLILAKATGNLIYRGSEYCNAFGFDKFYYCSTVMGCIYNCEYCYLQGLYNSSNIVAFVNTNDFFKAIEDIDNGTPALICCSYDSDIIALDGILGTVALWFKFAFEHPHLTFELRTKCASLKPFQNTKPLPNVIIAYTISPDSASGYEKGTSASIERLKAAAELARNGWRVRICIEPILTPIIPIEEYMVLIEKIIDIHKTSPLEDIVLGEFRMNKPYFKTISERLPYSKIFHNPFVSEANGSISYIAAKNTIKVLQNMIKTKSDLKIVCF